MPATIAAGIPRRSTRARQEGNTPPMPDAPNLDAMTSADLWTFYHEHKRGRNCAAELFAAKPAGYVRATRDLANYACNKAVAMECRARGQIGTAQDYEAICERIYSELPPFAKW